jgi:hypothetical protein
MANAPTPEFQKLWTDQIECLKLECQDAIQKHPDAAGVMERVHRVLVDIANLAGRTPSWCRAPSGVHDQILVTGLSMWGADERTGLSFVVVIVRLLSIYT